MSGSKTARQRSKQSSRQLATLSWIAGLGAVTAEAFALREQVGLPSARASLAAAAREGLLKRHQLLSDGPALYTATRAGMRAAALRGIEPCRVSPTNTRHLASCALIAAQLEQHHPGQAVMGERELRREERLVGASLASAEVSPYLRGSALHRPDLVLWPGQGVRESPIAIEVELTVKAPRRLVEICRAWARARWVQGVIYLAPEDVSRALHRAIAAAEVAERILVLPLSAYADE
jgi:hypothetical protein